MARSRQHRITRVEEFLADGGTIVTLTERAARAVISDYSNTQREQGREAWTTPQITTWDRWVQEQWSQRNSEGLLLLNDVQERSLWARIIRESPLRSEASHPERLAAAAQRAARLLAEFAPGELKESARSGWSGDPVDFSDWLTRFDTHCRKEHLISASRLALQLTRLLHLENTDPALERAPRPGLLLIGFDRLLQSQERLFKAWGAWRQDVDEPEPIATEFLEASDSSTEMQACLDWVVATTSENPIAQLMIVVGGLQSRRGELERAFFDRRNELKTGFEFSLGVPLERVGVVRSALLLLRWLHEPLSEFELDWLLTSGHATASPEEEIALAEAMIELRRHGQERPTWELKEFLSSFALLDEPRSRELSHTSSVTSSRSAKQISSKWTSRFTDAKKLFEAESERQSPLDWERAAVELLAATGWPGFQPQSSVVYQARERWNLVLEECASIGYDGSSMSWHEFLSTLGTAVADTTFATESTGTGVLITGPFESAGLSADGVWFLGANEESWPGRGSPNTLLPGSLQRAANMPHSSAQADWDLALRATDRLLVSADHVIFSYARQAGESESRASRMVTQKVGAPQRLKSSFTEHPHAAPVTEPFEDWSIVSFNGSFLQGGSAALTSQSICPFQAFTNARLGTHDSRPAEAGLNPRQRGQLLHAVLNSVWAGANSSGISTLTELQSITDMRAFVHRHVQRAIRQSFVPGRRNSIPARFPDRFLQLEEERLTNLISEWLLYESQRQPFSVSGTEVNREVKIAGLSIRVRMDRIDRLPDGSEVILDYKSGDASPSQWTGERPDNIQLPLYATESDSDHLEGLLFARVKPGEVSFCGRMRNAGSTLRSDLPPANKLLKDPLTDQQMDEWRRVIERLGNEFVRGQAEVNPKDGAETCERCYLHAVCRIYENPSLTLASSSDEDGAERESEVADD